MWEKKKRRDKIFGMKNLFAASREEVQRAKKKREKIRGFVIGKTVFFEKQRQCIKTL